MRVSHTQWNQATPRMRGGGLAPLTQIPKNGNGTLTGRRQSSVPFYGHTSQWRCKSGFDSKSILHLKPKFPDQGQWDQGARSDGTPVGSWRQPCNTLNTFSAVSDLGCGLLVSECNPGSRRLSADTGSPSAQRGKW